MKVNHFNKKYKPIFDIETWLKAHKPTQIRKSDFWNEIHEEYDRVIGEFKSLINCREPLTDKDDIILSPIETYNLIEEYKRRVDKLMLIFNIRIYLTYNENKSTGIRYVVYRALWKDDDGNNVKMFSKNLGPESKVLLKGVIPQHMIDSVTEDILHMMWSRYQIEYLDPSEMAMDKEGNWYV